MKGDDASEDSDDEILSEELSGSNPNAISAWHLALQQQSDGDKYGSSSESFTLPVMENGDDDVQPEGDVVQRLHAQLQHNSHAMQEEDKKNQLDHQTKASAMEKNKEQTIPFPTAPSRKSSMASTDTKAPAPPDLNRRDDYRQPGAIAMVGTHPTQSNTSGVALLLDDTSAEVTGSEQIMTEEVKEEEPSSHMVNAELVTEEASSLPHVAATSAVPMEEDDLPLSQRGLRSILKDRRVALCLCVFILVVAGLATGLSILFLQKDNENGITIPTTSSPTIAPPTPSPTSRMASLQTLLGKYYVDDVTPWGTANNSPQSKAFHWLATEDPWRPPPSEPEEDVLAAERLMVERYAMMVLYNSLDGPNWSDETAFLDLTLSICEWQVQYCFSFNDCGIFGVQCSGQFVTGFAVDDINAVGTIPTEIGLLSSLQTLYFQNNTGLVGTLPKELLQIPTLELLSLSGSGLTGSLPSEILQASNLAWLDLHENNMSGTIENVMNPELGGFAISENQFTGTIPESLGSLRDATYIEIGGNLLSGTLPNSLSSLTALSYLSVYNNARLSGPVPTSYSKLLFLSTLYMEGTNLTQVEWPFCGPSSAGLSHSQPPDYKEFYAECGGSNTPKVSCWCCTHCCDEGVCLRNSRGSS